MSSITISVIIPAYNEANRLPGTLGRVFAFLEELPHSSEVIVVENGSTDRTLEIAQKLTETYTSLRIFHEHLPGKGKAVRRGMMEASGAYRFICDADLSMPIEELKRFIPPACDCDVVIASRELPGSTRYNEPYYRHLTGRIFNMIIRLLVLSGLHDTQCGFKCFKAAAAEDIFRFQTLNGWAFDVEVLTIARRRGYEIKEIPIPWYYQEESKVSILRDSWQMFLDLLTIRKNARLGQYDRSS